MGSSDNDQFTKWLRTKDQLERGITILRNVKGSDSITKEEIESRLILSAVAIDCSVGLLDLRETTKKSMKYALWKWMVEYHSFASLAINENQQCQFSPTGQEQLISRNKKGEGGFVINSCSYTRNTGATQDDKIMNGLFTQQFKVKWKENKERLHEMCQNNLIGNAEPKMRASETIGGRGTQQTVTGDTSGGGKSTAYDGSFKISYLEDESKECMNSIVEVKESYEKYTSHEHGFKSAPLIPTSEPKPLTHDAYGVPQVRFQKCLDFGIQYLIQLEKKIAKVEAEQIAANNKEREIKAKRAHEKWVDLKCKIRSAKLRVEADARKKKQETEEAEARRKLERERMFDCGGKDEEQHTRRVKSPPKVPNKPHIGAIESTTEENCISLEWSSDGEVDFFLLSVYRDGETSSLLKWQDPENLDGTQNFLLQKSFYVYPGERYCFGVSCTSSVGSSPETRIEVISKPSTPDMPVLNRASEHSLEFRLENLEKDDPFFIDEKCLATVLPQTGSNYKAYVIESCANEESDDDWYQIWKGNAKAKSSAVIGGLVENSSYKFRIQSWSDEYCSSYGEPVLFHTMPRTPARPRKLVGNDSTGFVTLVWTAPKPWGNDIQRNSKKHSGLQPSLISLKQYFGKLDKESHGHIQSDDLIKLLKLLNVTVSDDDCDLLLKLIKEEHGNSITFTQFMELWSTFTVFLVHLKEEVEEKNGKQEIIYCGTNQRAKVKSLLPNKRYLFALQHLNLRGKSSLSPPTVIWTLPDSPESLHVIHACNNELILKVRMNPLTSFHKVHLAIRDRGSPSKENTSIQWESIYTGKSLMIKIPSLRPQKEYEFKCCLLNGEDRKGESICRTIQTTESKLVFDQKTLLTLFTIDCVGTHAIVEGDLILFTERVQVSSSETTRKHTNSSDSLTMLPHYHERSIVARVVAISIPPSSYHNGDDRMRLEVGWASTKDIAVGSILEKNKSELLQHEVLRGAWVDEARRIPSSI